MPEFDNPDPDNISTSSPDEGEPQPPDEPLSDLPIRPGFDIVDPAVYQLYPEDVHEGIAHHADHQWFDPVGEPQVRAKVDIPRDPGSAFLHARNPRFHASVGVEAVAGYLRSTYARIPNDPADKISAYLDLLADGDYANDGILMGNSVSIRRQVAARVIAAEDIPEAYFVHRQHVAGEQGHDTDSITPQLRQHIIEGVQADQHSSLMRWAAYLGNSGEYDSWFKYYVWESIGNMGTYNKDAGNFSTRSPSTVVPYPELNQEALAYVYEKLERSRIQHGHVEGDPGLQALLEVGSFSRLYAHAISEVTAEMTARRQTVDGSWTMFTATPNDATEVAHNLSEALQSYGTGWCTARESIAFGDLRGGDLYLYRTLDREGNATVPRIAIRMENGQVAEARGINAGQDVEPRMVDIAATHLRGLPGGESFMRKAEDVKQLAAIEQRVRADNNTQLSKKDIRFLYEIDREIDSFGLDRTPRIAEMKRLRGDRDRATVARILPEAIREQLVPAYEAYRSLMDELIFSPEVTTKRPPSHQDSVLKMAGFKTDPLSAIRGALATDEVAQLFSSTETAWQEDGTFDYLVDQIMHTSTGYTLVVAPRATVSMYQITRWAANLGTRAQHESGLSIADKVQVAPAFLDDPKVQGDAPHSRGKLQPRNIFKGRRPADSPIRISLIPTAKDDSSAFWTVADMSRALQGQQRAHPGGSVRVPDSLDAVAYWRCLSVRGENLDSAEAIRKAAITHFDPHENPIGRITRLIPVSGIHRGMPYFDYQEEGKEMTVRFAFG